MQSVNARVTRTHPPHPSAPSVELIACVCLLATALIAAGAAQETAPQKPPASEGEAAARPVVSESALDMALMDRRFIQRQIKCALGEAPCDPIGRRLKSLAPLVLRGSCPQCSKQEMQQIQNTLSYVQRNYPQEWTKIVRQYAG